MKGKKVYHTVEPKLLAPSIEEIKIIIVINNNKSHDCIDDK